VKSLRVKVRVLSSSTDFEILLDKVGAWSSFFIVPVPVILGAPPLKIALVGELNRTKKSSSNSTKRSPFTDIEIVWVVSPPAKVSMPLLVV